MTQTLDLLSPRELQLQGDEALIDRLGVAGFARYIEQFDNGGYGDYTEERKHMPEMNKSIDEICKIKPDF